MTEYRKPVVIEPLTKEEELADALKQYGDAMKHQAYVEYTLLREAREETLKAWMRAFELDTTIDQRLAACEEDS